MTNKEAIEFLKNMVDRESVGFVAPQGDGDVAIWQYHVEALNMAITALQAHWIPVTERLPEEDFCTGYGRQYSLDVLMTVHNLVDDETMVDYGHTTDGRWFSVAADTYIPDNWSVLAWMPLPTPWKGEEPT